MRYKLWYYRKEKFFSINRAEPDFFCEIVSETESQLVILIFGRSDCDDCFFKDVGQPTIPPLSDFVESKKGYFTFDGTNFFQLSGYRSRPNHCVEFILKPAKV